MDPEKDIPLVNKKILVACLFVVAIGTFFIISSLQSKTNLLIGKKIEETLPIDTMSFTTSTEGIIHKIVVPKKDLLFQVSITYDKNNRPVDVHIEKKAELSNFYKQVGYANKSNDTIFVYPIFTQAAYSEHGFYDYYNKKCDSECLTIPIPSTFVPKYAASMTTTMVLSLLNYSYITDVELDKNPDILKKYNKVIILHNEYVTKREFNAIINHPHTVYLFPNALYAEVKTDYANKTVTLIKGHGYPNSSITNGFDWKFDNSDLEYNIDCENMTFKIIPNGKMLNCYPAYRSLFDKSFLEAVKDS